jgi:hypothetical protein
MGRAIPREHPAVVLRSHYKLLRALLAVAMIAVVGLSAAVVILAIDSDEVSSTSSAKPIESINYGNSTSVNPSTGSPSARLRPDSPSTRLDGGPEEGTRGVVAARQPGVRFDGGPEEGSAALTQRSAPATFDPNSIKSAPGVRYDGGPEEGTRGLLTAPRSPSTRYDGGPEEGTRGPVSAGAASNALPDTRHDGGPEEGSRGSGH